MRNLLGILAVLGLAVAAPAREKRQVGCLSAFQNVPNVCLNNPNAQTFFSHPSDPSKFLQCDIYNRMYIIQCPQGEVFQLSTSGCQPAQQPVVTPRPVTIAPIITQPPVTMPHTAAVVNPNNPCTPQDIARGHLYFPYPSDKSKFYECDQQGQPRVLNCPNLLIWDQNILSCVYPVNASQTTGQVKPTPQIPAGHADNPCTAKAIASGHLFFPHPDQTKYIQCDLWGDAFTNSCPTKLVWNAILETCYRPYVATGKK